VQTSSQLAPTGARGDNCPAYVLPRVRELPSRLEPVVADGSGGLVTSRPASRAASMTTHPRGDLS
jgi:hypothetical protein